MAGCARGEIVREGEIGTYHCWSKCTQRAFLCGYDRETGIDFDYRRGWIESLLQYQSGVFAIDVGNFNVLSNHAHLIARTRPDVVAGWSDEEVARRWKLAWPEFVDGTWVREVSDQAIEELLLAPEKIQRIRGNLSNLSWFMARTKEPIARLCNAEMGVDGHFWAQRFGCRELLDDAAVLACYLYVDLNQLKAAMADSLDTSRHSAIYNRIVAAQAREVAASVAAFEATREGGEHVLPREVVRALFADCWLAPVCEDGPLMTETALAGTVARTPQGLILPVGTVLEPAVTADKSEAVPVEREPTAEPVEEPVAPAAELETHGPVSLDSSESRPEAPAASGSDVQLPTGCDGAEGVEERSPARGTADDELASTDAVCGDAGNSDAAEPDDRQAGPSAERAPAAGAAASARTNVEAQLNGGRSGLPLDRPRASDNPILAIPLEQYFTIVQQLAGEVLRRRSGEGLDGSLSDASVEAMVILETHGVNGAACLAVLDQLETRCRRALGAASRVSQRAEAAARRWFHGIGFCREVFVEPSLEDDGHT